MPDFSFKMHQIQFRLDPTGGAHSAPLDPIAGFGEGKGKERRGKKQEKRGGREREKERGEGGKGGEG